MGRCIIKLYPAQLQELLQVNGEITNILPSPDVTDPVGTLVIALAGEGIQEQPEGGAIPLVSYYTPAQRAALQERMKAEDPPEERPKRRKGK